MLKELVVEVAVKARLELVGGLLPHDRVRELDRRTRLNRHELVRLQRHLDHLCARG